jgi:lipocalin
MVILALVREVSCGWEWGPCPKVQVMQNFNVDSYIGVWYEQVRDKSIWYETGDCVQAKYTKLGDR